MLLSSISGLKRTVAMDPEGVDCARATVEAPITSAIATACKRCMSSSQGDFRNARVRRVVIWSCVRTQHLLYGSIYHDRLRLLHLDAIRRRIRGRRSQVDWTRRLLTGR